jgi:beta-lactamase class A
VSFRTAILAAALAASTLATILPPHTSALAQSPAPTPPTAPAQAILAAPTAQPTRPTRAVPPPSPTRPALSLTAVPARPTPSTVPMMPGLPSQTASPTEYQAPGQPANPCLTVDTARLAAPYVFKYGVRPSALQTDFFDESGLKGDGYRPDRLTGYAGSDSTLYATKWVKTGGPQWIGRFGLTGSEFHDLYLERRDDYLPTDVSGFNTPSGAVRYAVIWERNSAGLGWKVHRDVSRSGMQDLVDEYSETGWFPTRVEAYTLNGEPHYISTWLHMPCNWAMHNKMTRSQYQQRLDDYSASGLRLVHLDQFVDDGDVFYAGIWWAQQGPGQAVRSNRDWYLFQRFFNNYSCTGFVLDNFYAAAIPGATRYGGIWTFNAAPNVDQDSSFSRRIRQEVNCTPGRAGAAVINLTTGEQTMVHGDQIFGTSSTIKSAILYTLLRKADAEGTNLSTTQINVGAQFGTNQPTNNPPLQANQCYSLLFLARIMIDFSNNWATNRLIDYIGVANPPAGQCTGATNPPQSNLGMNRVNQELNALGFDRTRLRRYMTGTGSPGSSAAYAAGTDNTSTPREYASFLRAVHQNNGLLSNASSNQFWTLMAINGNDDDNILDAGVGTNWPTVVDTFQKAGSNTWGYDNSGNPTAQTGDYAHRPQIAAHLHRSEAGRLLFDNGQVVFYTVFINEADGPPTNALPLRVTLQNTLDCVVVGTVRQYSGQSTGANLSACQAD